MADQGTYPIYGIELALGRQLTSGIADVAAIGPLAASGRAYAGVLQQIAGILTRRYATLSRFAEAVVGVLPKVLIDGTRRIIRPGLIGDRHYDICLDCARPLATS
jgi:hypothetical protein